ncbi:hypothetical protein NFI96_028539 [Prochilodus magdalenae]|nr:hypothetical protein NFI96_028539 [Prochilodus magdalenae]
MGVSKQLSNDLKTKIVQRHGLGEGYRKLSQRFQLSVSTVRNIVRKWKTTGTVQVKARSGGPRKISNKQKRRMLRTVRVNPQTSTKDLQHDLAADGVTVHRSTIRHTLHKEMLYGRVMHIWTSQLHFGIRVQPAPSISLVMEVQASGGYDIYGQEVTHLAPRGWVKLDIFDHHNRIVSGRWKIPVRIPPPKPSMTTAEVNTVPQLDNAELYLRIVNTRDADIQSAAPISIYTAGIYRYAPVVCILN